MFPVPFLKDDRSLRLSTFLDGGTTFNKFGDLSNLMRYSAGLALTWVSPMGPLKVSIAEPLNDHPGDNLQRFQFMFGQQF
jgi:outer membrane protein insertion porin family